MKTTRKGLAGPMTKLAMAATAAVSIALLGACGSSDAGISEARLLEVAQAAARGSDRVEVEELASWIVEGRGDFALIDVRSQADFDAGAIDGARHVPVAELLSDDAVAALPTDRKVVLYSNGGEQSAKAATLLRLAGFDAKVLAGGYNAWHARVLNPDISPEELDGESLQVSAQRALACYFVGDRGAETARRPDVEFEPPVFDAEALDELPLPPPSKESC